MVRFESNVVMDEDFQKSHSVKLVYVKDFDMDSKKTFCEDCDKAINSGQEFLPIVIDSFGGSVYALCGMMDYLDSLAEGIEVITICNGVAMSAGAALFTYGKRRFLSRNGAVMFHDMSWCTIGKDTDIQADAKVFEKLKRRLYSTISTNLGHSKTWLHDELMKRGNADWTLDSKECRKYNVATKIGIPKLVTKLTLTKEIQE